MKYIGGQMIKPRCLLYNMPMFLSADNKLKPCCFLNTTEQWNDFIKWGKRLGFDVEHDLDITLHSVETIIESPTWKGLIASFSQENQGSDIVGRSCPPECYNSCGPGSYSSTNQSSKHSDYKSGN